MIKSRTKLATTIQILLCSLLADPSIGLFLIGQNYVNLGQKNLGTKMFVLGIVLSFVNAYLLVLPGVAFVIQLFYAIFLAIYVQFFQEDVINAKLSNDNWRTYSFGELFFSCLCFYIIISLYYKCIRQIVGAIVLQGFYSKVLPI